jgi:hypothetical protein
MLIILPDMSINNKRISNEANRHIRKFLKIAKEQLAKLQKHTKYHLYITEKQPKRHMKERVMT